jgi:uncharacterized protein (UPF0248 family)
MTTSLQHSSRRSSPPLSPHYNVPLSSCPSSSFFLLPHNDPLVSRHHLSRRFASSSDLDNNVDKEAPPEPMMNLYQEWTLDQDRLLWERRKESLPVLASLLGRGLRGVESRLAKLSDVDSPAYQRMFCQTDGDTEAQQRQSKKLVPAGEVLRRIQFDYNLDEQDFSVVHYDRVDDALVETPMDTPNTSVAGREEKFVFAIPEHRIMKIKYKEQLVWDREGRLDCVFGSMNGNGQTIDQVMKGYDEWKRTRDAEIEWNRQRQREVSSRIQQILGLERYALLKDLSSGLMNEHKDAATVNQKEVAGYVQSCLQLFRQVRNDPNSSLQPSWIPMTDVDALDTFSELAALLPNNELRAAILIEIESHFPSKQQSPSLKKYVLPELREEDLTETFVRGSGAGGQKINKTANRVVLVHNPTNVKVECQETRSLQQNRKIARKRLRLKIDEHLNGKQSKEGILANKRVTKKSRAKARNRARQRKKKAARASSDGDDDT